MTATDRRSARHLVSQVLGQNHMPFLREHIHARGLNALLIAHSVFNAEKLLRREPKRSSIVIPVVDPARLGYDVERLAALLGEIFTFGLTRHVAVEILPISLRSAIGVEEVAADGRFGTLCLFSGGVDSYVGLLRAAQEDDSIAGVFVAHSDQSKIIGMVRAIDREHLRPTHVSVYTAAAPPIGRGGYAQLRGFLYIVAAGAWVDRLAAVRLLVTECGPTMFQPRFGPYDAVTLTTHPVVVGAAHQVLQLVLQRPVEVQTPAANATKAELVAMSPRPRGLLATHSCISQRFGRHDGTCYGCVVRRLAFLAAGRRDVIYERDPLIDDSVQNDNLVSLLMFSQDFLINRRAMDDHEVGTLRSYGKLDLFRRFALDNFVAVDALVRGHRRVSSSARQMLRELLSAIGPEPLERRRNELARLLKQAHATSGSFGQQ